MGGGGGSTQNYEASIPYALLAREQWQDYKKRFLPIERQLISEGTNDMQYLTEPQMAKTAVDQAFKNQPGAVSRDLARSGVTMTPGEQAASDQSLNMAKAATSVAEANGARNNVWDRQNSIMSGGLSAVDRAIRK
jgi:hypothetical protein